MSIKLPHGPIPFTAYVLLLLFLVCGCVNPSGNDDQPEDPVDDGPTLYTVSYEVNGGSGSVPVDSDGHSAGSVFNIAAASGGLARSGFSFAGWSESAAGETTVYAPGQEFTMPARSVTFFAQWSASPLEWRAYLAGPNIQSASVTGVSGSTHTMVLSVQNPFEDGDSVVFISSGTLPVGAIENSPYVATGSGTTSPFFTAPSSGTALAWNTNGQVSGAYAIYKLDWTDLVPASLSVSGSGFSYTSHGLNPGDTVYLDGAAANQKAAGAYVVTTVPDPDTFTLSGTAPGAGDIYRIFARVDNTSGRVGF